MTKQDAIRLEAICEAYFREVVDSPQISFTLSGNLKITFSNGVDTNYFTFDHTTGKVVYVKFTGFMVDLADICNKVSRICATVVKRTNLETLLWSYENRRELI